MALTSRVTCSLQNMNRSLFCVTKPRRFFVKGNNAPLISFRYCSDSVGVKSTGGWSTSRKSQDPAPFFFDKEVQRCLLEMNTRYASKVFEPRKEGRLKSSTLKFLTDEELQNEQAKAARIARYYLQLPPVMAAGEDKSEILSQDPALQGLDESKILFIDIQFGVPDRDRLIVARDPDGTLRHANREERSRMLQTYFPQSQKFHEPPSLFSPPQLKSLLERSEFQFLLDMACVQFDPDDSEYVSVTSTVYECIDDNGKYDMLAGTRHYGSMAFYLIFNGRLDKFLNHCISTFKIKDAVAIVQVFYLTRPDIKDSCSPAAADDTNFLKEYISKHSKDRATLSKSLSAYLEFNLPSEAEEASMKSM